MVRIMGIDVGIRNLAMCIRDTESNKIISWRKYDISQFLCSPKQKGINDNIIPAVKQFILQPELQLLIQSSDLFVIERQMANPMTIIQICLAYQLAEKNPLVITPWAWRKGIGFPRVADYLARKQQSIDRVMQLISEEEKEVFEMTASKRDDLAEAYLLTVFGEKKLLQTKKRKSKKN